MKKKSFLKNLKEIIFFKITGRAVIFMLLGVVINIIGGILSGLTSLPIWFDTVGTIAISIQYGPIAGMIVAAVSAFIMVTINNASLFYILTGVSVGLVTGLLFPKNHKDEMLGIVSLALLSGIISAFISIPINNMYNNGYPGNIWGNALYDMLSRTVSNKNFVVFSSELFIDIPDRVFSFAVALLLRKITISHIHNKDTKKVNRDGKSKKGAAALSVFLITGLILSHGQNVTAEGLDFESDYEIEVFGSEDGIQSIQVNDIEQTKDGYFWVGTYSGLYRYDGVNFEAMNVDPKIRNVMYLYEDSKERLWIGTNDSGAFCYDPHTGDVTQYNTKNGLDADSIRSICEDSEGNIYLGTVLALSRVMGAEVKTFYEWTDIRYINRMAALEDGSVVGVTSSGIMFLFRDGLLLDEVSFSDEDGVYYRVVQYANGELVAGSSSGNMDVYTIENDTFKKKGTVDNKSLSFFNDIVYSSYYGGYFVCAENGMGFLDENSKKLTVIEQGVVKGETSGAVVDMQHNIWFSSTKTGVVKFSKTLFENVTNKAGIEEQVTNAIYIDDEEIYIGMDNGLKIIDKDSFKETHKRVQDDLVGTRIRNIFKDSKGNLWISTYGEAGLVKVSPSGDIISFAGQGEGVLDNRARSVIELSDGRILAASSKGLAFIENDKVVDTLDMADGLENQVILSMIERDDGTILAASDGDGIYIIKNNRIIGHIGQAEGLNTAVVLRIVKCSGGYIYVTSNALYYDNGSRVTQLDSFYYSNNYDIIVKDGMCWIPSSAGLFVIDEESLITNNASDITLLDGTWGLKTTFTSNAWNVLSGDDLYLCCVDGVRKISTANYNNMKNDYQLHLENIITNDSVITEENGKFVIPPGSGRVEFNIAVNNFSLSNPLVYYYLEGREDEANLCYQKDIIPLIYTDLPGGDYVLHIDVLDSNTGEKEISKKINITKEKMMYEKIYFQLYLILVGSFLMFYIGWLFYAINKRSKRIRGLQKEMTTDPMTKILNKAGSHKALEEACRNERGVLMMIDLDSFKLVNDLYGHDMGDKILIRFAELLKQNLKEGDICGRLGGDEFVGFMKNTQEEEDVEKFTRVMNREIVKSAKEYMGEDMNIPLGTSIGAVRVPTDGDEFEELFKLADKALYVVKQNGKHGFAFYQKTGGGKDQDSSEHDNNDLSQIKKIIGERNEGKGAYLVNFDKLQVIYKFLNRNKLVNNSETAFARLSIEGPGDGLSDEIRDSFEDALVVNLKKDDVISVFSGRFYVLLAGDAKEAAEDKLKKVILAWKKSGEFGDYNVTYEIECVGE